MVKSGKMLENGSNVVGDSFSFRMIIFANEIPDIILELSLIVFLFVCFHFANEYLRTSNILVSKWG